MCGRFRQCSQNVRPYPSPAQPSSNSTQTQHAWAASMSDRKLTWLTNHGWFHLIEICLSSNCPGLMNLLQIPTKPSKRLQLCRQNRAARGLVISERYLEGGLRWTSYVVSVRDSLDMFSGFEIESSSRSPRKPATAVQWKLAMCTCIGGFNRAMTHLRCKTSGTCGSCPTFLNWHKKRALLLSRLPGRHCHGQKKLG